MLRLSCEHLTFWSQWGWYRVAMNWFLWRSIAYWRATIDSVFFSKREAQVTPLRLWRHRMNRRHHTPSHRRNPPIISHCPDRRIYWDDRKSSRGRPRSCRDERRNCNEEGEQTVQAQRQTHRTFLSSASKQLATFAPMVTSEGMFLPRHCGRDSPTVPEDSQNGLLSVDGQERF